MEERGDTKMKIKDMTNGELTALLEEIKAELIRREVEDSPLKVQRMPMSLVLIILDGVVARGLLRFQNGKLGNLRNLYLDRFVGTTTAGKLKLWLVPAISSA